MKLYVISMATGILVGIIYALIQVRSPAPPAIALIGLLGMLIGEQVVPPIKRMLAGEPVTVSWFHKECIPRISGVPAKTEPDVPSTSPSKADSSTKQT